MGAQVLLALLTVVALGAAPVMLLLIARHSAAAAARTRSLLIRRHLWPTGPVHPSGPPLEQLAADLRRLYPAAHFPGRGVRMPKQRGVLMAYDQRLVESARALGLATHLAECPLEGYDRAAERLRVEIALGDAGLVWQSGIGIDPAA